MWRVRMSADIVTGAKQARVWPPVLAIDPGSSETGLGLRIGTDALEAVTVEQGEPTGNHAESVRYAREVIETAKEVTRRNRDRLNDEATCRGVAPGGLRHAVETLIAPTGRPTKGRQTAVAPRVLASLPTASTVLGAAVGTWPRTILVALNRPGFVRGSQVPRRRVPARSGGDGSSLRARRAGSCRSRRGVVGG